MRRKSARAGQACDVLPNFEVFDALADGLYDTCVFGAWNDGALTVTLMKK